jgi:hypothetical protein
LWLCIALAGQISVWGLVEVWEERKQRALTISLRKQHRPAFRSKAVRTVPVAWAWVPTLTVMTSDPLNLFLHIKWGYQENQLHEIVAKMKGFIISKIQSNNAP